MEKAVLTDEQKVESISMKKLVNVRILCIAWLLAQSAQLTAKKSVQKMHGKSFKVEKRTVKTGELSQLPVAHKHLPTRACTDVGSSVATPLPNLPLNGSVPQTNPSALPGAFYPNPAAANSIANPPQTVGLTFTMNTVALSSDITNRQPDTYGVAGETQFVIGDNVGVISFDKQGNRDGMVDVSVENLANLDGNFSTFMRNAGARIKYDRSANRFVIVMLTADTNAGSLGYNGVTVAVSDTGTITDDTQWTVFTIFDESIIPDENGCPGDVTSPVGSGVFYGYPCLGIDQNALYISSSVFLNSTSAWVSNSLFVIQKSSLYDAQNPVFITAFRDVTKTLGGQFVGDQATFRVDSTLFPVDNFGDAQFGYAICQDPVFWSMLRLYRIVDAGSRAPSIAGPVEINVMSTFTQENSTTPLVPTLASPNFSGNPYGFAGLLESRDDGLADSTHMNNQQIYTAHSLLMNSSGVSSAAGDRVGIRWYQLDVTGDATGNGEGDETETTVPALVQAGSLFDTRAPGNQLSYYFPAIMSNDNGDISICGNVSGNLQNIAAFFVGRTDADPLGTLRIGAGAPANPSIFYTGTRTYTRGLNVLTQAPFIPGQRWGNMSFSSLDPADNSTMWTIQGVNRNGVNTSVVAKLLAP